MGSMQGSEVVQLYTRKNDEARDNPIKILKAFERVFLAEGEKQRITLSFPIKELARYDLEFDKFTVVNGSYDFMVGNSSTNFYFKKTLEIIE
jgi:beta-glucosidase